MALAASVPSGNSSRLLLALGAVLLSGCAVIVKVTATIRLAVKAIRGRRANSCRAGTLRPESVLDALVVSAELENRRGRSEDIPVARLSRALGSASHLSSAANAKTAGKYGHAI